MVAAPTAPAQLPPPGLTGLDPRWSRLVQVPSIDGVGRSWHILDNQEPDPDLTLLCVHGNPSWSYLFRQLLRDAPAKVRVVAVDQLDMGFSERTGQVRRLATRIEDLCALTDHMGIAGPVVTVAHDWGGPVSLGWVLQHLEQCRGVVLMNTAVHQPAGSPAPSLIRLVRSRPMLQGVTVSTTTFIRGALEMSRPRLGADVKAGFLAPYNQASRRHAIREFVADIPLSAEHPSAETLDAVAAGLRLLSDHPVLLLWGSADPIFSDLYLHDLEARMPHANVHRYAKAGHFVSEDADTTAATLAWVKTLPTREQVEPTERPRPVLTSSLEVPSTLADIQQAPADRIAITEMEDPSLSATFGELTNLVERTAAGLASAGVQPGDRVAVLVPPGIDLAATLYGCWRAGAVAVLVDAGLGPKGMSQAVKAASPAYIVGIPKALAAAKTLRWPGQRIGATALSSKQRSLLGATTDLPTLQRTTDPAPPVPTIGDPAAVVFTSGATGPSKGVCYSHGQLMAQRDALRSLYNIGDHDRLVAAFAPFALYGPALGITSVVPDMDVAAPATLTAAALGRAVQVADATLVFASPAALANVVATADTLTDANRAAFAKVRLLLSAGAPVRPALLESAAALFPNATAATPYGMTECLPVASITLDEIVSSAGGPGVCVGQPVEGVEVAIDPLDDTGALHGQLVAQPHVAGEVVVRAAHARTGYDRLWHTSHEASQPTGWHRSGDVGQLDSAGNLWIEGRLRDIIVGADGVVTPVRLEHGCEQCPEVGLAAVVGVGPVSNQVCVAVVEAKPGVSKPRLAPTELADSVRAAAGHEFAAVFVVPALPVDRRHNSKIDRARVQAWAEQALAGGRLTKL